MTSTADEKTPPAGGPPPAKTEPGKGDDYGKPPTMGDLRSMVAETVESALKPFLDKLGAGGGGQGDKPEPAKTEPAAAGGGQPDIATMVDAALAKVLGDRDKKSADDAHAAQHKAIEAAAAERRPFERPRRSGWLGNIWD